MIKNMNKTRGFTLPEILVGIAIMAVIATLIAVNVSSFIQGQALNNAVDEVTVLLNDARTRTLSASGSNYYGVRLESTKATLFLGPTYSSGTSTNKVYTPHSSIVLSSITLNGGGADVFFDPVNGDTSNYGTLIVKRSSTTSGQKTITITKTGLVSSN